ncbi:MAG: hypothetical protein CO158_00995 [Piscirickettsiaceae bacterium CG_4_9_14_3_um_filter_43_564]|nr:CBS domain-containing protein [Thiomicrospira sp.]OIP94740.1 MAG: hypothetical protein AUK56_08010 [Thiomicrospira sp. CG2_30_44_34]PIQ03184.1 MAG: hypothetical protein COW74_07905 [Piscirickettsiaceae bacterium CG18_big_fil_WC_8_21_14_2_50_44_103]PIU39459.1 MAG: hypothetical protein COT01_01185 [Piscirickettsiaceae bacterium CG07_land_8_20_14_0_80_44_28]PIW58546.1 MAG: hypothetical protein COW14_00605 [Piscirickettsiaceae bacterium CG12_big_fil_rev_8_21_14_0_65_44_934]PIW78405.1 MAG: hypot
MFIVYSPEGRNRVTSAQGFPKLKVDPTKETLALGESEMDQLPLNPVQKREGRSQSALKQYQAVQHPPRTPVVKISEMMVSPVITIEQHQTIEDAWKLIKNAKIHHLPVLNEDGRLVGLLTSHDLLSLKYEANPSVRDNEMIVSDWMKKEVVTTKADTDIRRVAYVMSEYNLSCLPIMSELDEVVGMVTQSDIVRRLGQSPPLEVYA